MKFCKLSYPVKLTRTSPNTIMAEFRDVPGAMTEAATEEEALYWAEDALLVLLSGLMDKRRPIPAPSEPRRDERLVEVPPMPAMKLAIYQAMLDQDVTEAALAAGMGIDADGCAAFSTSTTAPASIIFCARWRSWANRSR